jgi:hypothetical protein
VFWCFLVSGVPVPYGFSRALTIFYRMNRILCIILPLSLAVDLLASPCEFSNAARSRSHGLQQLGSTIAYIPPIYSSGIQLKCLQWYDLRHTSSVYGFLGLRLRPSGSEKTNCIASSGSRAGDDAGQLHFRQSASRRLPPAGLRIFHCIERCKCEHRLSLISQLCQLTW